MRYDDSGITRSYSRAARRGSRPMFITAAWPFGLTNAGSMSGMEWLYRWEGHEARVAIRRDSQTWEQLYLDGTLSAEQRGWHFFPATLTAKVGDADGEKHEVRVRVGWGFRCR